MRPINGMLHIGRLYTIYRYFLLLFEITMTMTATMFTMFVILTTMIKIIVNTGNPKDYDFFQLKIQFPEVCAVCK